MSVDPGRSLRIQKHMDDFERRFKIYDAEIRKLKSIIKNLNNPATAPVSVAATPSPDPPTDHGGLAGLEDDEDHEQYVPVDGSRDTDKISFDTAASVTPDEGDIYWHDDDKTVNIKTDTDTIVQVGQEMMLRINNDTGVQLNNGEMVYITGVASSRPTITLADASTWEDSQKTLGIATSDIANGAEGFVTVFGLVRDVDTDGLTPGDELFLSTTAGGFTTTRPTYPNFVISIGYVIDAHLTDGIIFFRVDNNDDGGFFNGTIKENFDAVVTEAGGVITMSLERTGTGDLTMRFSDGYSTLDCTDPLKTIVLTAGTDPAPQPNYIYILQSTKVLTKSTSGWPATEHIKIAYFLVPSAAFVSTDGVYVNQNWNDHNADTINQGHLSHIAQKIRLMQATWFTGVAGNGTDTYLTPGIGTTDFKSTAGVIFQMHAQTFPAFDTSTGDTVLVKNWNGDAYHNITDLFDIIADSGGNAIGNNKYFNLIVWGAVNKSGEAQFIFINLPSGFYNTQAAAENDVSGYDDFTIPRDFNVDSSVGFLIARITIKMAATWVHASTVDLRGTTPQTATGGAAGSRYTDSEAIAAVEGEATLDLTGILKVTIAGGGGDRDLFILDNPGNDTYTWYGDDAANDLILKTTTADNILRIAREGTIKNQIDNGGFYTGAGDDLRIYHDGSDSYITNSATKLIYTGNVLQLQHTAPIIRYRETGAAANNTIWDMMVDGEQFKGRLINDAEAAVQNWLVVDRTAQVVDDITFPQGNVNISAGNFIMAGAAGDDERLQLPYLNAIPASVANGSIWMEADGLHIYYAGAEKIVAGV